MTPVWQTRTEDPAVLTHVLRDAGVLGDEKVQAVEVESASTKVVSRVMRLRLAYNRVAPGAPDRLILKTNHPELSQAGWLRGRNEVAFYRRVAPAAPSRFVPRCFEAYADEASGDWHLILEDLTDTHAVTGDWPLPPTLPACERIVETHACHQALHWDAPHLDALMETWRFRDAAALDQYLARLSVQVDHFAERMGDSLPPERRALYDRLLDAAPRLAERYRVRHALTVVQGDAHVWNCFLPRDERVEPRLFDWDSWRIDVGASDIAHMMTVHWYPDRRHRVERALLDRYHAALLAGGIENYDRRALDEDYRFSVLWQITWPVLQEGSGVPARIWWNNLERVMMPFDDLGCEALLR